MTTWGELRTLVVECMAEYQAGAAEAAGAATMAEATIYSRMSRTFKQMVREYVRRNPRVNVTTTAMAYTADAESVALPAAAQLKDLRSVDRLVGTEYEPLEHVTDWQDREARKTESIGPQPVSTSFGYFVQGTSLFVVPRPAEALTLRLRHDAAVAAVTSAASATEVTVIPDAWQDLIARKTALSFLREIGGGDSLAKEVDPEWADFVRWCAEGPNKGVRFVHEPT